jgi:3-oxoacyl-[acyl-carrier-protein] synthase III
MDGALSGRIGISAIATFEPPWVLGNDWFEGTIPRKFVHHTGIEARPISLEDEVTMAVRAAKNLQRETGCDLADCAGVVFASPSFIPLPVAREHLTLELARRERLQRTARQFVRRLGIPDCLALGINWFCSGFSKACALVHQRMLPAVNLGENQFFLVVTSSRISRITDYACKQTAGLFGDLATATLVARSTSRKYPAHFELLHASAAKQWADGVFFDFQLRDNVLAPDADSGQRLEQQRLVFTLDGMGIADIAPRAMANALAGALAATGTEKTDLRFILPHQAGAGIVRLTAMKVEQLGIGGEVINGLTSRVGNVSSSSIPYGLKHHWSKFTGLIGCPTAAVGAPGAAEVSQGCLLLRSTPLHDRLARTAA